MKTVKLENHKNTKMIAHRGLSGLYLENTMSAFKAAGKISFYGIESDTHVTKDGKFIIFHDDTTGRLAKANLNVENTDYKTLRLLPIGFHRMPSLPEYIRCCKNYDKVAVLELKNPMTRANIESLLSVIGNLDYLDKTIFISFAEQNLTFVRQINLEQTVQFLTKKFNTKVFDTLVKNRFDLDIDFTSLDKDIIDICHDNGIKVNCWTVNELADAQRLIDYGVDYITTNIIE